MADPFAIFDDLELTDDGTEEPPWPSGFDLYLMAEAAGGGLSFEADQDTTRPREGVTLKAPAAICHPTGPRSGPAPVPAEPAPASGERSDPATTTGG